MFCIRSEFAFPPRQSRGEDYLQRVTYRLLTYMYQTVTDKRGSTFSMTLLKREVVNRDISPHGIHLHSIFFL